MKYSFTTRFVLIIFLYLTSLTLSQTNTVGLISYDSTASYNGYTLFSPIASDDTYLIDNKGFLVHSWSSSYRPAQSVMLLPDGSLLRTAYVQNADPFVAGGTGGRIEKYDWNGNLTWSFNYYSANYCTHHDAAYLPNGDILLIAWELKSYNQAIAAGRDPAKLDTALWSGEIIEVKPTGTTGGDIVWQWHTWDHLIQDYDSTKANYGDVSKHPELVDINNGSTGEDWLHINSVSYNPQRDEILLSVHNFNEIWVIDHSTTTAQAAGHTGGKEGKGGDIIYRWGNPQAYDAGTAADQKLFAQHDASWIDTGLAGQGDILIFNNGDGRPDGNYSSIDEITPPINSNGQYYIDSTGKFGPAKTTWQYIAETPTTFFAKNISGAERLPNGNTLICDGTAGEFFEVDHYGNKVWDYINPVTRNGILTQGSTPVFNLVFRIYRYSPDYSGLVGKDLSEKGRIEKYPQNVLTNYTEPTVYRLNQNYPNPFNPTTTIQYAIPKSEHVTLKVYDELGREVTTLVNENKSAAKYKISFNASSLPSGIYFYKITAGSFSEVKKLILLR